MISDLSTDFTVIAGVNDGACATRTVPIETEAATPSVCLFKRLQLVESSAGTRTACSLSCRHCESAERAQQIERGSSA